MLLRMGVISKDQLDQVWKDQGMKYNMRRFHSYLLERGLLPYINVNKFSHHMYELLDKFFVQGMKEKPDGRQQFPAQAGWDRESYDPNRESQGEAKATSGGSTSPKDA